MTGESTQPENMTASISKPSYLHNEEFLHLTQLNSEEERMKTFASWPVQYPVDPSRLAKAGFYYTGKEDEVICFSCHGHIKNWSYGDIVLKKHADLFPNCDFVKNGSNNVPLVKITSKSKGPSLFFEKVNGLNSNITETDSFDFSLMQSECARLKTFFEKWPLSFINISDLARAGFFYTGTGDKVQCAYCKGKISNWEPGDVPFQEHLRHFPWCDYLSQNVTNVKKGQSWYQSASQDVCGNEKTTEVKSSLCNKLFEDNKSLEDLGVHLHKGPIHPQQASLQARLRSFATWPLDSPVSKEELAAAGFFYIGINDRTTCFHCNGGLCSWEKGDNPWVEHARWFSSCDFLRLNKGIDFIKSCVAQNSSKPKEHLSQPFPKTGCVGTLLKKVDEAMKSKDVKYVLETELFPAYIVRAAILLQLKQTGSSFSNIDELCVAASYLKEEMERDSPDLKPVNIKDLNICEKITDSNTIADSQQVTDVTQSVPSSSTSFCESKKSNPKKYDTLEDDECKDLRMCKICMENEVGVAFLPCGHLHACTVCASALKHCPMCRKAIQAIVRVYLD